MVVSAGQFCTLVNAVVTGNVQQNGGKLTLINTKVDGNLQISNGGSFTIGPGTVVGGALQVQNLPSSSGQNEICGTSVGGNLQVGNNAAAVLVGAPSSCAGNTVKGNLQITNDSGATEVFNNIVGNQLQCQNNKTISGGGNQAGAKQGQCGTF